MSMMGEVKMDLQGDGWMMGEVKMDLQGDGWMVDKNFPFLIT